MGAHSFEGACSVQEVTSWLGIGGCGLASARLVIDSGTSFGNELERIRILEVANMQAKDMDRGMTNGTSLR